MTNNDLVTLIASDSMTLIGSLRAGDCAAWWLPGVGLGRGKSFGDAGPTNVLLAACVSPAQSPLLEGIGRSQQTGPSPHPAGPGKDFAKTAVGPQRDLFGTPFGPLFSSKRVQNMQICLIFEEIRSAAPRRWFGKWWMRLRRHLWSMTMRITFVYIRSGLAGRLRPNELDRRKTNPPNRRTLSARSHHAGMAG